MNSRIDEHTEKFNKNLENIKKNQTQLNIISKIKNILEVIHSRPNDTEEQIHELEERVVKNTQAEQEQQQKQKAGSRWQSRKTLDSPSSMNTPKLQQYIGQHIECYIENIECITYILYVTYRAIYTAIHRTS